MTTLPNYTPSYGGGQVNNPANVIPTSGTPNETVLTENRVGTLAVDNANATVYALSSKSGGVDTWTTIGSSTSGYSITPYIVGPVGFAPYQTIQSAIDAANAADLSSGASIYIQPGVYTEDLTLYVGLSFVAVEANVDTNRVQIIGTHTPPIENGSVSFQHINFYGTDSIFFSEEAGQCYLVFETCNWDITEDGYIFDMDNWVGPTGIPSGPNGLAVVNCGDLSEGDSGFLKNSVGAMDVSILFSYIGSYLGSGSSIPLLVSGNFQASEADFYCPVSITGSGECFLELNGHHGVGVTVGGSSTGYIANSNFAGLDDPFLTMSSSGDWSVGSCYVDTSSTNAVDGSGIGTLSLGSISYNDSSLVANTVTASYMPTNTGTVTSVLGNITATNGNFVSSTSGKGILLDSPSTSGAAASPVIVNGRSGRATFTSVSVAANADITLTLTNSSITATTTQIVYGWRGATTGSALSMKSVTPGSGTCAFVVTNGVGATTSTADIVIDFLVINT